jgi:hypothetical protein
MRIHVPASRLLCWLVVVPIVGLASCSSGPRLNPVEGTVVVNKAPAKGAVVTFHLKDADPITAIRPIGLAQEDGKFTLFTGDKPGARAGEYIVTFIWPKEIAPKSTKKFVQEAPESRDQLDGAFVDPHTSRFKVEIKAGDNKLEPFNLK